MTTKMHSQRFSQMRNLDVNREELRKYISDNNELVLNRIGEETLKNYIIHFLEKYEVSQKKLMNYDEFIAFAGGKRLDAGAPIVKELYNFILKNILLPDYTNTESEDFKEIDAILERAIHRVEELMKKRDENGFFSLHFYNLDQIMRSISFYDDFEPQMIRIGGVFERILIENDSEKNIFSVTIPVRLARKIKVNQDVSDIRPAMTEKDLNAILGIILDKNTKNGRKYKKSHGLDVRVEEEKVTGNQLYQNAPKDEEYKLYRVFVPQMTLDSFAHKDDVRELLSEVFRAAEEIVNSIAKKSGGEYQKKIHNFDTGVVFSDESSEESTNKSGVSKEEMKKFEKLRVSLKEKISLDDIGGQPKAKAEIEKIILSLKHEEVMKSWGARPTSGIVFE